MAFWSDWSDGKKWLMGIFGAVIVAAIIGGAREFWPPVADPAPPPPLKPPTKIVDVPINIYAKQDAEGNRPGLDTHDSEHQTYDPKIGKRIIEAKVIHNPYASEFVDGGTKVSPNDNKITLNLKLTDAAHKSGPKVATPKNRKGLRSLFGFS